jgi:hypothetical protein
MDSGSPIEGIDPASSPQRKALELNLDPSQYGTFAEIGAGQEVADWFLRVGGASGTVAQTICAYDKAFSDERYGHGTRYVSRERLLAMLEREYQTLEAQLRGPRGPECGSSPLRIRRGEGFRATTSGTAGWESGSGKWGRSQHCTSRYATGR